MHIVKFDLSHSLYTHKKVLDTVLIPAVLWKGGEDLLHRLFDVGAEGLVKGTLILPLQATLLVFFFFFFSNSFYCSKS